MFSKGSVDKYLNKKFFFYTVITITISLFIYNILSNIFFKPTLTTNIPYVRTLTIGSSSNSNNSFYPGEVRGRYESNLAFQVPGKIIHRNVNLGDTVKTGDVLMQIDPQDIEQNLEASQAALNAAEANYKLANDNAQRYKQLYANGAVSQAMMEQYVNQLDAATASLRQARASLIASSNKLSYTRLIADNDGVIANITGEIGQVIAAGTPVISVVKDGEYEVQIFVPENRLDQIQPEQKAFVNFWALKDVQARGYIREISPVADSVTHTYKVRIAIPEIPTLVKLGMTAKVQLSLDTEENILIPNTAIYQTGEQPQVWLVNGDKVHSQNIFIDGYDGNNVKVSSGLKNGDIVVIGGVNKLTENQSVRLEAGGQ